MGTVRVIFGARITVVITSGVSGNGAVRCSRSSCGSCGIGGAVPLGVLGPTRGLVGSVDGSHGMGVVSPVMGIFFGSSLKERLVSV